MRKTLCFLSVFVAVVFLSGQNKLHFYTDVFAWCPEGKVKRISPGDGIYFQPLVR